MIFLAEREGLPAGDLGLGAVFFFWVVATCSEVALLREARLLSREGGPDSTIRGCVPSGRKD